MDLEPELKIAKRLAEEASKIALDYRKNLSVWLKAQGEGPVSNADMDIDSLISNTLRKEFRHDLIISEESFNEHDLSLLNKSKRVWFIDPIDGTSSYVLGQDDFVVMIGLCIDNIARLGVISQPSSNTMWLGIYDPINNKNFCQKIINEQIFPIKAGKEEKKLNDISLVLSSSYRGTKQDKLAQSLNAKNIIKISSVGLKTMFVLEKKADLYVAWSKKVKLWDTCAADAIMHASGMYMAYIDQSPLDYQRFIKHEKPFFASDFKPDKHLVDLFINIAS